MTLEGTISMEPVKDKLRNLSQYMPEQSQIIYDFGRFLADRLNPKLLPVDFLTAAITALDDLRRGQDGYTGKKIAGHLTGQYPLVYFILESRIPSIAKAVCPQDFANEVKNNYNFIMAEDL